MSPKITKILLTWPTNKNLSLVLFPTVITIPQVLLIFTWCYLKGYSTYTVFTWCYLKGYLYLPGATSRATYIYLLLPQGLLILTWCYLKGLLTWCYFKVLILTFWHLKTTVVKQLFLYMNWFDCIIEYIYECCHPYTIVLKSSFQCIFRPNIFPYPGATIKPVVTWVRPV